MTAFNLASIRKNVSDATKATLALLAMCAVLGAPEALAGDKKEQELASAEQVAQISINTANAQLLSEVMVGVGEKKAQAIIAYREKHGDFTSLDQLTEVKGIGSATLEKNRARLTL